ncbi:DUF268 domain-containing protein [uncultured Brachyspira sp.]|uniref:DUF268 domain-containing protein n=1 Tax=uncultured Brachyspira sp. TaxID=221953 RepID=UPI002638638D|nr:DUF268 domain-containing protein [uncultured Brachyspira sp.]
MTKEKLDKINKIVWFIPFKCLRDSIRKKLINKENKKWINECIEKYNALNEYCRFPIEAKNNWYIFGENTSNIGFDAHYLYHPAWAARCLKEINPEKHIDISSITHFCTIASAFIPIDYYEYRPPKIYNLENFGTYSCDIKQLPFEDNSIESISCMHAIEHIGLGRYGDEIDPDGDLKGINELKRVTKNGGNILFAVPVGEPKVQYNAHRIYSYDMIIEYFEGCKLINYSLIPDNSLEDNVGIINNATKELTDKQKYACGCFWFQKI